MKSFHTRRASGGEVFIVAVVIAGFFWLMSQGIMQIQDIWSYVGFLLIIVVFYFALLLCRMIFFHMVGGNAYPWWEHVQHHEEYLKGEHKKTSKGNRHN